MIYKYPIFDVSSPEGFLTSQQTKYSKVLSLKFSDMQALNFPTECRAGARWPSAPYIYASGF